MLVVVASVDLGVVDVGAGVLTQRGAIGLDSVLHTS